ncbi:Ankyrin repeat domain-containing protein 50-like protein [Leptotrombidium deliense]|uniref:Ankyrin repeat domain-containing protein 50-like protein n=1 Tax=Leptotrombidium deliense TaxID=299467 RepID=A0A443SC38_9ACAR|nr:Ankyrin repeat domain-containing protein 50-like protein [Leptotrombidium deliense]
MSEISARTDIECDESADVFVGREWVFLKLMKTLDLRIDCPNTTVILGCPGAGKTVLLRKLLKTNKFRRSILAYYECTDISDVLHFLHHLESQIKEKIEPRKNNSNDEKAKTEGAESVELDDLFRQLILYPLLECDKITDEHRHLIVVDSVDINKDICEIVSHHIHILPKWIHVIVTARSKRRKGFTKMFSGSRKIVIDEMRKVSVISDMKCYIVHRIKTMNCPPLGHAAKKALNQIGIKSNGCFLYVKLILDCIENGVFEIDKEDIGATLNGLYLALCTKLFDNNPSHEVVFKNIISVVLASHDYKASKEHLQEIFRNTENFQQLLEMLYTYCLLQPSNESYVSITHRSLAEWITDVKHCTKRFLCESSFGHTALALLSTENDPDNICHHITNSNIEGFQTYHYALWLLLSCSGEEVERLTETNDSPVVDYIRVCGETVKSLPDCDETPSKVTERASYLSTEVSAQERNSREIPSPVEEGDVQTQSLLLNAIINKDIESVHKLLKNDPELANAVDANSKSALFYAIETGDVEMVQLLLETDADVNHVLNGDETTPLIIAVKMNLERISELLLEADADVDACDSTSRTPLVFAVINNVSPKIVEMLLFWGAHTDYIDDEGKSLLGIAANEASCNVEVVKLLLAVGCDELHRDNFGRTPLHLAAKHGNVDVIEALCDVGGDTLINSKDNDGNIALHESALNGHVDACKILMAEDNVNSLSHCGKTALRMAALNGHVNVISLAVENGADINYIDADGRSTLYCVASSSDDDPVSLEILRHLASLGADLEARDFEKRTALHVASWQGHRNTVKTLLECGADVNACDGEGRTPLHMCAWNGFTDILGLLIDADADINHRTSQGATPLLIGAQQGHIDVCAMLLAAGADAAHCDSYGRNSQDVAINCGHRNIAILIESHLNSCGDQCPTLSSHASTAETAPISDFDPLFFHCNSTKSKMENSKSSECSNSRKTKKLSPISKLTKLLH